VTGCLGTSRGSSCGSSSTTWTTPCVWVPWHVARLVTRLVVDYFNYAAHPGATARRAARHRLLRLRARLSALARRAARHAARRRLLRLRRVSGCLGTSHGPSRGSSSTTLCAATSFYSHTGSTSAVRRDYLSRGNTGSTSSTSCATAMSSSGRIVSTIHLD
jgi:hypothetical protein